MALLKGVHLKAALVCYPASSESITFWRNVWLAVIKQQPAYKCIGEILLFLL